MSRKKNKKADHKRKKPNATFPPIFSVGTQVRVKPGTTVPDFEDIPLGGWAGRIGEVDQRSNPPTYSVEWNRHTLNNMHPVFRNRCERDGLALESMWLSESDLELDNGEPVTIEQPTRITTRPLSKNNQDDRIRAIFALTSNDPVPPSNIENLRRYARFLKSQLSFPFQAKYFVENSLFQQTEYLVTVVGLLDADDCDEEDGVLCEVAERNEFIELPLADLEVRRDRRNRQLVEDYSYWFGNWASAEFTTSVVLHPVSMSEVTASATSAEVTPILMSEATISADGHPTLDDAEPEPPGSWVKALAECGLCGAFYGGVLGSLLGAVEGSVTGASVGAAIMGFIGWAIGTSYGRAAGAMNQARYGALIGGVVCLLPGVLMGAMLGAMVVAYAGSLIGAIVGRLIGGLLTKWKRRVKVPFGWIVCGAGIGAVVLAGYRDYEAARLWALHGAWVGGVSAVVLLSGLAGLSVLGSWAPQSRVES